MNFGDIIKIILAAIFNTSASSTGKRSGGHKMYSNEQDRCGICANWTGSRDSSYLGIGTRYVIVYDDKARCAARGYSSSDNYYRTGLCREKGHFQKCGNLCS